MQNENKKSSHVLHIVICGIISLCIGGGIGYGIARVIHSLSSDEQKLVDEYRLLKEDWLYGNESQYISDLAAKGLISEVASDQNDSYTFYTSTQAEQGLSTDGNGFGFSSHYYNGGLYITDVSIQSTSYAAGLRKGDVLYSVSISNEEYNFKEHSLTEINQKLSSVADTTTQFIFKGERKGSDGMVSSITITMVRGKYSQNVIEILKTPQSDSSKTMVVKVNTFLGEPASALKGTLKDYYSSNQIETLIIDLRGNGGGYITQATEMASLFVKKGTLLCQLKDKNDNVVSQIIQENEPTYNIPNIRIILDGQSASASEIFTLAMIAGSNTTTYGLTSYGKGIAQSFKTFSDGSVVRYTYAKVYGPTKDNTSTMSIHKVGITPDNKYSYDYSYLYNTVDYSSIGISEYGQNYFLKVLDCLYPSIYPTSYSQTYHFTDAIKAYGKAMSIKYSNNELEIAFNENGGMYKPLNDILNKEIYDKYLEYYDSVTDFAYRG